MRTIYLTMVCALFLVACNQSNNQNKTESHTEMTSEKEQQINKEEAEDTDLNEKVSYEKPEIAYVKNDALYFYYPETQKAKKFKEESEKVFNVVFDSKENSIYYTVVRDSILWLKKAELSDDTPLITDLLDCNMKESDVYSETYGGKARLIFTKKNQVVLPYDFSWDLYNFGKLLVYSTKTKQVKKREYDYDLLVGSLNWENVPHRIKDGKDLIYTGGKSPVNLTNQFDLDKLISDPDYAEEREFINFKFSPDKSKLLFGVFLEFGDTAHGPYCVADINGENQKILMESGLSSEDPPIWVGNQLIFKESRYDDEGKKIVLMLTNSADNSPVVIAEGIDCFTARL